MILKNTFKNYSGSNQRSDSEEHFMNAKEFMYIFEWAGLQDNKILTYQEIVIAFFLSKQTTIDEIGTN